MYDKIGISMVSLLILYNFLKYFKMYELSQNIKCHNRDLRCLDHHAGYIATGGADKVFKLLSVADGKV